MANSFLAGLGGALSGLGPVAQVLMQRKIDEEERQRQRLVQDRLFQQQQEQWNAQFGLQKKQDERAAQAQSLNTLFQKLNFANPSTDLDPGLVQQAQGENIPLAQHFVTPMPDMTSIAGLPPTPSTQIGAKPTYRRSPTVSEQSSLQGIESSKTQQKSAELSQEATRQQMISAAIAQAQAIRDDAQKQGMYGRVGSLKPGQQLNPLDILLSGRNAEDFWTPDQKLAQDVKRATAIASAGDAVRGRLNDQEKARLTNQLSQQASRTTQELGKIQLAYENMTSGFEQIKKALSGGARSGSPGFEVLIQQFQKILDPLSIVREGEFARTTGLVPLIDRMINSFRGWKSGTPFDVAQAQAYVDQAADMLKRASEWSETRIAPLRNQAQAQGLDWNQIYVPFAGSGQEKFDLVFVPMPQQPKAPANPFGGSGLGSTNKFKFGGS